MILFTFTLLLDLGATTRIVRVEGKTETQAIDRAVRGLPSHERARIKGVRVRSIDYSEEKPNEQAN